MNSVFIHGLAQFTTKAPFLNDRRNASFATFLEAGADNDLDVCLSHIDYYSRSQRAISRAWVYRDGWKLVKNKKVALCYYHGRTSRIYRELSMLKERLNIPIINHADLEMICDDKLLTYKLFPEFVPPLFPLTSAAHLQYALRLLQSEHVVVKPRFGSEGRGVFILKKRQLLDALPRTMLAQEFVDSSAGILGVRSVHDFRILMVNGVIDHAYIRVPRGDSLICNSHQGGKKIFVDLEDIPSEAVAITRRVDGALSHYGTRVYTADFMRDHNGRYWVIELNSKPGTAYYDGNERVRYAFYSRVARAVKETLQ